jgi:hypothetical protein
LPVQESGRRRILVLSLFLFRKSKPRAAQRSTLPKSLLVAASLWESEGGVEGGPNAGGRRAEMN